MSIRFGLALFGVIVITGSAFSETPQPSSDGRFIARSKTSHWKASKLMGLKVYNDNNEHVGDISELLVSDNGSVEVVVISIGGFLGLGKRSIGVPLSEITPPSQVEKKEKVEEAKSKNPSELGAAVESQEAKSSDKPSGTPPFVILRIKTEDLKSAPEFEYLQ